MDCLFCRICLWKYLGFENSMWSPALHFTSGFLYRHLLRLPWLRASFHDRGRGREGYREGDQITRERRLVALEGPQQSQQTSERGSYGRPGISERDLSESSTLHALLRWGDSWKRPMVRKMSSWHENHLHHIWTLCLRFGYASQLNSYSITDLFSFKLDILQFQVRISPRKCSGISEKSLPIWEH